MDNATARMDLQSNAEALARPFFDVACVVAAVALSAVTIAGMRAVNDTEPCVYDGENEGDGTSKDSKERKEPVFLE